MNNIDEVQLRKSISVMKKNNELFECRILFENKKVYSAYFNDVDTFIKELKKFDTTNASVYITLNKINEGCFSRSQKNHFESNTKTTTSDNDITDYEWFFIDLDPKRPAGISSSDDELQMAKTLGNNIYLFLENLGFSKPVTAISGNGVHLLYKIDLKNTKENVELLKSCLKTINMLFDNEKVEPDMRNFNPSRIIKCYGSRTSKGVSTEERPHRMSKIIQVPENIETTDVLYLKKLVDMQPKMDEPKAYNNYNPKEFDLEDWMQNHGLHYRIAPYSDGTKYILDECPFDSNHKGKDACVFRSTSGAIGFNCFHNSCSNNRWSDLRKLLDPEYAERRDQQYQKKIYGHHNSDGFKPKEKPKVEIVEKEGNPVFESALQILDKPSEPETFIKTGIKKLDFCLRGLQNNYVTLLSGGSGSAKSTLLSEICLNAVQEGTRVCVFSGELSDKNFMKWMNLQAAGKNKVLTTQYANYYTVGQKNQRQIAEWLEGHFWLYNNDYGNNFKAIMKQCEKVVADKQIDLLILDNLMAFDTSELGQTQNDIDTAFIWELKRFATRTHIHIIFVAHPRKTISFLRAEDISGSANLRNATDNLFIVHRIDADFKRKSNEMFRWKWTTEEDAKESNNPVFGATNCIEICKDRDGTNRDVFIPLYYELESKRLKNSKEENIVYGWNKSMEEYIHFAFEMEEDDENPFVIE